MISTILAMAILQLGIVRVKYMPTPPQLDGVIDSIWSKADSIFRFHQYEPDYGNPPSFKTVVKFLQNKNNLYILVVGYTGKEIPRASASTAEDRITIFLDTFFSHQEAYFFTVTAGGSHYDGIVSDNGNRWNMSWEGYWFQKTRAYPHKYVVEIKIPFRSIRYSKAENKWGLQVKRYIPQYFETDYWVLPPRQEEHQVSNFGILEGINPTSSGLGMEFYPVGIIKSEKYGDTNPIQSVKFGLDFTWNVTSDIMINTTFKPDFAQIEADPFALNLSKYELYLSERRPFFVEANEIFKLARSSFGELFNPFTIFYSRRIGRKLPDGTEVPIDFGSKLTYKSPNWQFGAMSVYTEGRYYTLDTVYYEPPALWNVFRIKAIPFEKSIAGFMLASMHANFTDSTENYINYEFDGQLNAGPHSLTYQFVHSSSYDMKSGNGANLAYTYISETWVGGAGASWVVENLDFSSTGYMNVEPGKRAVVSFGRISYFPEGKIFKSINVIYAGVNRARFDPVNEYKVGVFNNMEFRAGYFLGISFTTGNSYDFGKNVKTWWYHLEVGKNKGNFTYGTWNNFNKGWNYYRGIYAWQGNGGIWSDFPITDLISGSLLARYWIEFDTTGRILDIYTSVRPSLSWQISRDKELTLSSEIIPVKTDAWEINEGRIGLRFDYNFRPKSRIHLVWNEHFVKEGETIKSDERIMAFKVRWAIPF